jgi:hypothetical protein
MSAPHIALALTALSAALLAWRWPALMRERRPLDLLAAAVLVLAVYTLWRLALTAVFGSVTSDWNGSRLAPTVALLYGYDLYYPATQGPITNHVYGPMAAFAYLPAALLRTPTPAVLAAATQQVLFVFGAMLLFVSRAGAGSAAPRPLVVACALAACLMMSRYPGTAYWFSMVHADGPALALGLLACAALATPDGALPSRRALLASALAAVLACWTKQTAAPLPLALALALWVVHGRAAALRYVAYLAGIGAVLSAVFFAWFGRPMLFNMVEMVSRHGWIKPGIGGLAIVTWRFLSSIWALLALLAVGLAALRVVAGAEWRRGAMAWLAPLLAALLLLPTGALGANKLGGEPSSFHSAYYLLAAIAVLFARAGGRVAAAQPMGWAFCALAIAAAWQSGRCSLPADRPPLWQNQQQVAYEYALRHPGETYFPWAPLATLLAEGRLYHFEYGMLDRFLAGYEPSPEHVRANLPPHLKQLAAHARVWTFNQYFPEYTEELTLPDLPGLVVRRRPS